MTLTFHGKPRIGNDCGDVWGRNQMWIACDDIVTGCTTYHAQKSFLRGFEI